LPGVGHKGDLTEWVERGGTAEALAQLIDQTPVHGLPLQLPATDAFRTAGPPLALPAVVSVFQRHLYLPDPSPVYVMLGAVAANYMTGDPVWLMVVAGPGSGKTEQLGSLSALPSVHAAATI